MTNFDVRALLGTIKAGESKQVSVAIPANIRPEDVLVEISGNCECGGRVVPNPKRKNEWICSRSHWWNRSRHARLMLEAEKVEIAS